MNEHAKALHDLSESVFRLAENLTTMAEELQWLAVQADARDKTWATR